MLYRGFLVFLPVWLLENDVSLVSVGAITSLMLAIGIIAQPLGGFIFDRLGSKIIFVVSPLIAGTALFLITWLDGWLMILLIVIIGASISMTFPVALTAASIINGKDDAGMSVGFVFGISSTMSSFTPLLTGLMADQFGLESAFRFLIILPLLATFMTIFQMNFENTGGVPRRFERNWPNKLKILAPIHPALPKSVLKQTKNPPTMMSSGLFLQNAPIGFNLN